MNGTRERYELMANPSYGKLVFLGGLAVLLSSVTPFVPFAPAPLALAFLLFGLSKTLLMGVGFAVALFIIASVSKLTAVNGILYLVSLFYAWIVQRIIVKREQPHRGIFRYGLIVVVAGAALYFVAANLTGFSLHEEVTKMVVTMTEQIQNDQNYQTIIAQGGEQARIIQDLIKKPETAVSELLSWLPAGYFVGVFLTIWLTLMMVLRNRIAWRGKVSYPYSMNDFMRFKTPEFLILPLIAGLALVAGGDYLFGSEVAQKVGVNILYCVGVFFFFQGLGVLVDFLTFIKMAGFIRSLFIIFSVMIGWRVIVIVGMFDVWINFRKFFKNKESNGDRT